MTGSPPEVMATRHAIQVAIGDLAAGSTVLVACSGGADSLALAAATSVVAPRLGLVARAGVVDHGLQSDSAAVAERAAGLCRSLGLPATVVRVVVGVGAGPEDAARTARRTALIDEAEVWSAAAILLGHSRDDQAETVLLRLARGSGARSLAGMARRADPWRRPFLDLPRATLRTAAVAALGADAPWDDPHNADPAYRRVRVRTALPGIVEALGVDIVPGLARTADLLRDDADALDGWAAEVASRESSRVLDGVEIDPAVLAALPRGVRSRVIRDLARAAGSPADDLSAGHIRAVEALISDWHGQGPISLPGRVEAIRDCGRLCLRAAPNRTEQPDRTGQPDRGG